MTALPPLTQAELDLYAYQWPCVIGHGDALERFRLTGKLPTHHLGGHPTRADRTHRTLSRLVLTGRLDEVLDEWPEFMLSAPQWKVMRSLRVTLDAWAAEERSAMLAAEDARVVQRMEDEQDWQTFLRMAKDSGL